MSFMIWTWCTPEFRSLINYKLSLTNKEYAHIGFLIRLPSFSSISFLFCMISFFSLRDSSSNSFFYILVIDFHLIPSCLLIYLLPTSPRLSLIRDLSSLQNISYPVCALQGFLLLILFSSIS